MRHVEVASAYRDGRYRLEISISGQQYHNNLLLVQ